MPTLSEKIRAARSSPGSSISEKIAATGYRPERSGSEAQSVADEIRRGEYRPPETRWLDYTPVGALHNLVSDRSFSSKVDPFIRNVGAQTLRPIEAARDFYWDATDHPQANKPRTDAFSASQATARAQKGIAATAGRVAGEVVNPFYMAPGLGVAAGGARLGLRGYRLAATAGMADAFLGGGIEGYLESEGDTFDDKLEDAARSAFIAAPIGGLAGVGLEGLGRLAFGADFSGFPEASLTKATDGERAWSDAVRAADAEATRYASPRSPAPTDAAIPQPQPGAEAPTLALEGPAAPAGLLPPARSDAPTQMLPATVSDAPPVPPSAVAAQSGLPPAIREVGGKGDFHSAPPPHRERYDTGFSHVGDDALNARSKEIDRELARLEDSVVIGSGDPGEARYWRLQEEAGRIDREFRRRKLSTQHPSDLLDEFFAQAQRLRDGASSPNYDHAEDLAEALVVASTSKGGRSEGFVFDDALARKLDPAIVGSDRAEIHFSALEKAARAGLIEPPAPKAGVSRPVGGGVSLYSDPLFIQTAARLVSDGIKAGKWAAGHTVAASRWLASRGAKAVADASAAARELIGQFGRGIRRHVPRIWSEYREFARSRNVPSRRNVGAVGKGVSPKRLARRVESLESRLDKAVLRGREQVAKIKGLQKAKVERYDALNKIIRALPPAVKRRLPDAAIGSFHKVKTPAAFTKAVERLDKQVSRVLKEEARMAELKQAIKEIIPPDRRASFREKFNLLRTDDDLENALNRVVEYARGREVAAATKANLGKAKKGIGKLADIEAYPAAAPAVERLRALGISPADGWSGSLRTKLSKLPVAEQNKIVAEVKAARKALAEAKAAPARRLKAEAEALTREMQEHIEKTTTAKFQGKPGQAGIRKASWASRFFKDYHLTPESLMEMMGAPFTRGFFEPLEAGVDRAYAMMRDSIKSLERRLDAAGLSNKSEARKALFKSFAKDADSLKRVRLSQNSSPELTRLERMYIWGSVQDVETRANLLDGQPIAVKRSPNKSFGIDEDGIQALGKSLTRDERAFVSAIAETHRETWEPTNAAHVRMTGRQLPRSETHLFRQSAGKGGPTPFDDALQHGGNPSGKSMSVIQSRVKGVKDPLVIGNLMVDFDRNLQRSAAYAHLVEPAAMARSVIGGKTLANSIDMAWGAQRSRVIERFIQDTIDDMGMFFRPKDGVLGTLATLVDNTAKGALGGNPWTMVKQVPSVSNAITEIPAVDMAVGLKAANPFSELGRAVRKRMIEQSGMMWARYHMHSSRVAGVIENKGAHAFGGRRGLTDYSMMGIEQFDMGAIASIWHGAEVSIKRLRPELSGDAYIHAVRDLANKATRRSQPNFAYINLSHTARQSRQNPALKPFTMFMSQLNTNYNMIARAIASGDPKRIATVLSVVAIAQPMMITAIDQARSSAYGNSRPEGETAMLRALDFGLQTGENVLSDVYFAGHFSAVARHLRQKYLLDQRYPYSDPQTPVAGQASDLITGLLAEIDVAMRSMGDGELTQRDYDRAMRGAEKILTGGTGLAGLPVQGPYRTGRGIYRGLAGE